MTNMLGVLLRYFDDDKKWKTLIDEFGIKTTDPYLDFEPLLWYERKLNDQLLTKVWMTPYKEKFDKRLIEFGIKFNAISKDLVIFDWDKSLQDLKSVEVLDYYRVNPSHYNS